MCEVGEVGRGVYEHLCKQRVTHAYVHNKDQFSPFFSLHSNTNSLQGLSVVLMFMAKWNGWSLEVRTGQLQFGNCKYDTEHLVHTL